MLIYGKSKSVKVHYKGQRGVGVYDVVFDGLIDNMRKRYRETASDMMKQEYETYMQVTPCDECHGQRLKKSSLAVTVGDKISIRLRNCPFLNWQSILINLHLHRFRKNR